MGRSRSLLYRIVASLTAIGMLFWPVGQAAAQMDPLNVIGDFPARGNFAPFPNGDGPSQSQPPFSQSRFGSGFSLPSGLAPNGFGQPSFPQSRFGPPGPFREGAAEAMPLATSPGAAVPKVFFLVNGVSAPKNKAGAWAAQPLALTVPNNSYELGTALQLQPVVT
jgi:hypothetical protein